MKRFENRIGILEFEWVNLSCRKIKQKRVTKLDFRVIDRSSNSRISIVLSIVLHAPEIPNFEAA